MLGTSKPASSIASSRASAARALRRLSGWMGRHMDGVLGWVLAIIGFLLARDAAVRLDLFGPGAAASS